MEDILLEMTKADLLDRLQDVSPRKTGLQEDPLPCIYLPRDASSHHRDNPHQRGLGLFQSLWRLAPLRRKTDVNLPDFYDRMPIHYAAQQGRPEVLDLLIKAGELGRLFEKSISRRPFLKPCFPNCELHPRMSRTSVY